ncbi:MAG TPA: hypothetical protein VF629_04585 [Hymenobacter sp.]|uniref:hypothetical protein n=1 Tax=Hymenobacter sp. TaxID=1898978 RepID=UPI002ED7E795
MKTLFRPSTPHAESQSGTANRFAAAFKTTGLGLVALVGTAFSASAQTPPAEPVRVTQANDLSLRIRINNPTQQAAQLRVVQLNNGSWILNETHREPAYGTLMKFDKLPAGRYAVVLQVGPDRYRYTVDVRQQKQGKSLAVRELTTRHTDNVVASAGL